MVSRFTAALGRLMVAVMAAGLLVPTVAFAWGSVAHASVDCQIGQSPWYEVRVTNKDVVFTHTIIYVTLAPRATATRTITKETSVSGSITIKVGTAASASAIIFGASLELGVELELAGSVTDGGAVSLSMQNPSHTKYNDYVFFNGTRTAFGNWTRYYCSAGVAKVSSSGIWKSWEGQYYGVIRCNDDTAIFNQYHEWSVQYEAVRSC